MKLISRSEHETKSIAAQLIDGLGNQHVVALDGNLGAGKTVFVKGIAEHVGVAEVVQSPTFILMNLYPLKNKRFTNLVHIDCYRLDASEELLAIGLQDYLDDPKALVVIEWASKIKKVLKKDVLWITLTVTGGQE